MLQPTPPFRAISRGVDRAPGGLQACPFRGGCCKGRVLFDASLTNAPLASRCQPHRRAMVKLA
eukprot:2248547-Alexandrium_andersonii.AAC.1